MVGRYKDTARWVLLLYFDDLGSYEANHNHYPQPYLKSVLFMFMISTIPVSLVKSATE